MSWRDDLRPASFRGAPFLVDGHDVAGGRRLAMHEYPFREDAWPEDLGGKPREYTIDCYVLGRDYMPARDRLLAALESTAGAGELSHPYLGSLRVVVRDFRMAESTREGGMARFSVTFVPAGDNRYPADAANTSRTVNNAADAASTSAIAEFARRFSVEGLTGWSITEIEDELSRTLSGVTDLVGDAAGAIAAEIRAPYNMGALIVGNIQKIAALAAQPKEALRLYKGLFDSGKDSPAVPTTTATRRQQAQSTDAMQELTRTSSVIEACRAAAGTDFAAADDAIAARADLIAALEERMEATDPVTGAPIGDDLFDRLRALRAAVVEDLRVRGAKLPRVTYYTPGATLPARVLAYKIYGDASRAEEIVARNKIRHPGFVPGGKPLEVLSDD